MIHRAYMPVYMNSGKIVAGRRDGWTGGRVDGDSKVLQEVLADLKKTLKPEITLFFYQFHAKKALFKVSKI